MVFLRFVDVVAAHRDEGIGPGDWAAWATAVVTLLALGAAFWAGRASWEVLRLERDRDENSEKRLERAEQANLVAHWDVPDRPEGVHPLGGKDANAEGPGIQIRNASDVPIYYVELRIWKLTEEVFNQLDNSSGGAKIRLWLDERHMQGTDAYPSPLGTIPPGDFYYAISPQDFITGTSIEFIDSTGRRWYRGIRGKLKRLD